MKKKTRQSVKNGKKRNDQAKARFSKENPLDRPVRSAQTPLLLQENGCRPVVDLRGGLRGRSRCYDRDGRPGRPGAFMRESETEHCTVGRDRPVLSQAMRGRVSRISECRVNHRKKHIFFQCEIPGFLSD